MHDEEEEVMAEFASLNPGRFIRCAACGVCYGVYYMVYARFGPGNFCTCFPIDFVVSARNNSDFFFACLFASLTLPIGIYTYTLYGYRKKIMELCIAYNIYDTSYTYTYTHRDVYLEKGNKMEIYILLNCNSFLSRRIYEQSKWILKLTDTHKHIQSRQHTFKSIHSVHRQLGMRMIRNRSYI